VGGFVSSLLHRTHTMLNVTHCNSLPLLLLLLLLLLLHLQAMVFALENADAAADVVEVLEEALTLPETSPATKLARLFLVNDILHNSTAPVRNASR
jgi:hypothetical protein